MYFETFYYKITFDTFSDRREKGLYGNWKDERLERRYKTDGKLNRRHSGITYIDPTGVLNSKFVPLKTFIFSHVTY